MDEIQIFQNSEFGEVRTIIIDGEPWFVGNDIAKPLGYAAPKNAVAKFVDDEDKQKHRFDSSGQRREMIVINESGLYSLIFGSKLESAKKFKSWVTKEVLPSIRKTGGYGAPKTIPEQIQLLAQGNVELNKRVDNIQADLQSLKMDLPILQIEADRITNAVKAKGVNVMGGKDSNAYHNRSIVNKVYRDIYRQICRNFEVSSYKALKRSQCDMVIEVVRKYELPIILADQIEQVNAQQKLDI